MTCSNFDIWHCGYGGNNIPIYINEARIHLHRTERGQRTDSYAFPDEKPTWP